MKKLIYIIFALLVTSGAISQEQHTEITVVSFNVRYNSAEDGINVWENRKEWLTHSIRFFDSDLIGAQEVTHTQVIDMQQLLPTYSYVGIGREGGNKGEFSPIFYKKERFELLDHNTFWLSKTPMQVASKGWDAALPRIVTWAWFKDKATGTIFYHFNTHFDHRGKNARIESAKLLSEEITSIAKTEPVLVTGDFNSAPKSEPIKILLEHNLYDPYLTLDKDRVYGPEYSSNGWNVKGKSSKDRIDYIFYKGAVKPLSIQILDAQRGDQFISDHFPVIAKVKISD
ncbi:endonuclease/exonuclease/phosphatase family protein [Gelidibacter mesophilus]|uniref:endonuclease/exonuclease/phosphatase family protein n=1 Tax=Gelidibacter mesophilus TaxID=169050 RepID=UPI0004135247|nr:endonuclease/exonuclease/phosphatase family protein [Gelidibacter mesophilus]